jgi:O-antigen ligase
LKPARPLSILQAICLLIPLAFSTATFDHYATPKLAIFLFGSFLVLLAVLLDYRGAINLPRVILVSLLGYGVLQLYQTLRLPMPLEGFFGAYGQSESLAVQIGYAALFLGGYLFVRTERDHWAWLGTIAVTTLLIALYGIFQYFYGDPVDPREISRMESLFGDPNSLGAYLILVYPLVLWRAAGEGRPWARALLLLVLYLIAAALALTFSRSAWLSFIVGLTVLSGSLIRSAQTAKPFWTRFLVILGCGAVACLLVKFGLLWLAVGISLSLIGWGFIKKFFLDNNLLVHTLMILLIAGVVTSQVFTLYQPRAGRDYNLGSRIDSLSKGQDSGRILIWQTAWRVFQQTPVLGQGIGTFQDSFHRFQSARAVNHWGPDKDLRQVHNEFLHFLGTQGLLGLAGYLWLLVSVLSCARPRVGGSIENRIGPYALWASILSYLVFVQFAYSLVHYAFLFWVELGILLGFCFPAPAASVTTAGPRPLRLKVLLAAAVVFWAIPVFNLYYSDQLYNQAFNQARHHRYSLALDNYRRVVALTPWNYHYRYRYALTLMRAARWARNNEVLRVQYYLESERILRRLELEYPERYQVSLLLGDLAFRQFNFDRAAGYYRKAIRQYPLNYKLHYRLAKTEKLRGRLREALSAYNAGCKVNRGAMKELEAAESFSILPQQL